MIDDHPLSRDAIARVLTQGGYVVRCAANGREGIAAFRARRPDVVITDLIMPEMDGLETIMTIRAAAPEQPIIAISGGGRFSASDLLNMARKLGASEMLAKPFEPEQLLDLVARCAKGAPTSSGS
ncbi:MAG TPA: response regulator [Stellaceae bacterium]|nr:response regulator [Stellaceae bacterium]